MKIYVVTHKEYKFPQSDVYCPIQVGCENNQPLNNMLHDNTGNNISNKNSSFCELTALYWIWKNTTDDICGLVHYRRYFKGSGYREFCGHVILDEQEMDSYVNLYDIIVASKLNMGSQTVFSQYMNNHHVKDISIVYEVICDVYPEYGTSFRQVMNSSSISLFNMFLGKKKFIDEYAEWLFDILFRVEKLVDIDKYSPYQKRLFGFLAERLLNVWLHHNRQRINIGHLPVVSIENTKPVKPLLAHRVKLRLKNYKFIFEKFLLVSIADYIFKKY